MLHSSRERVKQGSFKQRESRRAQRNAKQKAPAMAIGGASEKSGRDRF